MESLPNTSLKILVGRNVDCIKGLLAIVIAVDHNDFLRSLYPNLFAPVTFPVLGYFLLLFTFGNKVLSARYIADRVARYLIPYWWALTAASFAYFLMYKGGKSPSDGFVAWGLAAVIGTAPFVKSASGFLMLWFLPCLFGLTCLLAVFNAIQSIPAKRFAVGLAITAHLMIPLLPSSSLFWLPCGVAIMMNIFILGLIWRKFLNVQLPQLWGPIVFAIFAVSYGALVSVPVHLEMATLDLVGIDAPWFMILQDLAGLGGVLTIVWLSSFIRKRHWFEQMGKNSIWLYLLHPVAYVILGKVWPTVPTDDLSPLVVFINGCLTTFVALGSAYAVSIYVIRSRFLSAWITPRSWDQWPPVRFLQTRN